MIKPIVGADSPPGPEPGSFLVIVYQPSTGTSSRPFSITLGDVVPAGEPDKPGGTGAGDPVKSGYPGHSGGPAPR